MEYESFVIDTEDVNIDSNFESKTLAKIQINFNLRGFESRVIIRDNLEEKISEVLDKSLEDIDPEDWITVSYESEYLKYQSWGSYQKKKYLNLDSIINTIENMARIQKSSQTDGKITVIFMT